MLAATRLFDRRHRTVGIEMTRAGAISQFRNSIFRFLRFLIFLVRVRFEIVGMTPGTIRPVGAVRPGRGLCIALVTIDAGHPRMMIARIFGR